MYLYFVGLVSSCSGSLLNLNNITPVGLSNPAYVYIKGNKVALLGYDDVECYNNGIECADLVKMTEQIGNAKENSDLVIIMFSWGSEYTHNPTNRQVQLAHAAIDSGADLVLGNHPHWYQPIEVYKNKQIEIFQ